MNTIYDPYSVPISEVLKIWQFQSYQTKQFPEPLSDLKALAKAVRDLQEDFKDMKKKK